MLAWHIVQNSHHLIMQRLSALLSTHQHARVLLQCSGEQRQPSGEDVCRWSCRQLVLTASAYDMIMLAAEPPLRKNGDVAARARTISRSGSTARAKRMRHCQRNAMALSRLRPTALDRMIGKADFSRISKTISGPDERARAATLQVEPPRRETLKSGLGFF